MKVFIPVENERVAPRFCSAENALIFEVSGKGDIKNRRLIKLPLTGNFEKAKFVKDLKIDVIVCLGIESWIFYYLSGFGIKILPGVNGNVSNVIERFMTGNLSFRSFPIYSFNIIHRGRYRRCMKGRKGLHNGHFKNRFM